MALRALTLRAEITNFTKELDKLRAKDAEFETRHGEIETAIRELAEKEDATDEDRAAVEATVDEFEKQREEHDAAKSELEGKIEKLQKDLDAEEAKQPAPATDPTTKDERKETKVMNTRKKFFGMDIQERDAFLAREDVKNLLAHVRELGASGQTRAVTGGNVLIPEVVLDLLRENIIEFSKLYKHCNVQRVPGHARQTIMGVIPEAVWTEMCAALNELYFTFTQEEVDGYKVGGYVPVCRAMLEDSDINLAEVIITGLGAAIGLALDKAILFGTGVKMPTGICTANYSTASQNVAISAENSEGLSLFKNLLLGSAAAKGKYSRGSKTWVMNETTYNALQAEGLSINAAGMIVSAVNGSMPVIGGDCEVLDFVPNNLIVGGYFDLYLLAEREGTFIARSDEARFIQDQVVFKGVARYDGKPVIPNGFVTIAINGATIATQLATVTFAPDYANEDMNLLTVTAAAGGTTGKTVLTVGNKVSAGNALKFKVSESVDGLNVGDTVTGWDDLTSGTTAITAAAGTPIGVVELDAAGRVVSVGTVLSVPKTA